jgi:hypothetical protein
VSIVRLLYIFHVIILLFLTACAAGNTNETKPPDNSMPGNQPVVDEPIAANNKPDAEQLMNEYKKRFNRLIDTDENLKVQGFQTKEEAAQYLAEIMSTELAQLTVDAFFEEDDGSLYVIPRDGPIWLDEEEPYDLEQLTKNKYYLSQEHRGGLRGDLTFIVIFQKQEDHWIIEEFQTDPH